MYSSLGPPPFPCPPTVRHDPRRSDAHFSQRVVRERRRARLTGMAAGRFGRVARAVVADVTPLRVSPAYRRLWLGLGVSNIGQQMTAVAVAWQVYVITRSSFMVGLIGGFALIPLVVFGL